MVRESLTWIYMFSIHYRHIGDAATTCICPDGYKGYRCEIPDYDVLSGELMFHF